jgi:hypothetical protein
MVLFKRFSIGLTIHLVKKNHVSNDLYAELKKSSTYFTYMVNPQIGRPLSKIVGAIGLFFLIKSAHPSIKEPSV